MKTASVLLGLLLALPAAAGPLQPRPEKSDTWSESFSFQADLADGSYVWAQLSFTNLGPGSGTGLCRVLVRRPGREPFQAQTRVGRDGWVYTPEDAKGTDRLEVDEGLCAAHGGATPGLRIALEGQRVQLRFAQPFRPTVPPGGEVRLPSGRYYRSELLLPFGEVQVQLQGKRVAQGEGKAPTEQLKGGAYVDHSRSTVKPAELARRWVRFRALREAPRTLVLVREAPDGSLGSAYLWEEGSAPRVLSGFSLSRTGERADTAWRAELPGAGTLRALSLLHRSAPVQELGKVLGSILRPLLGSPVTYTHRAQLQREGAAPLSGLLEVSLEED